MNGKNDQITYNGLIVPKQPEKMNYTEAEFEKLDEET